MLYVTHIKRVVHPRIPSAYAICVAQTCTYMRTCMNMRAHIRGIPYTDVEMSTGVMNIAIASPASPASHLNDAGW